MIQVHQGTLVKSDLQLFTNGNRNVPIAEKLLAQIGLVSVQEFVDVMGHTKGIVSFRVLFNLEFYGIYFYFSMSSALTYVCESDR